MFKIEKGVPAPTKRSTKYPFDQMEVGDSFAVPRDKEADVRASAYYHNKKSGFGKFVARIDKQAQRRARVACRRQRRESLRMTPAPAPSSWPFPRYVLKRGVLVMVRQRKPLPDLSKAEPAPF